MHNKRQSNEQVLDTKLLIQEILKSCWYLLILYVAATSLDLFFTSKPLLTFVLGTIVLPAAAMAATMGILGFVLRMLKKNNEFALLTGLNVLAAIVIVTLQDMPMSVYLLVLPIQVSLFFYRKNLIVYSCALGILNLLVILAFSSRIRADIAPADIIMIISLLIASALIIYNLMTRALQTAQRLIHVAIEKQDLQTQNAFMERLNRIDPATELYNHRSFHEYLDSVLALRQHTEIPVHLALLDIDNFKKINDQFGHRTGDTIIAFVSKKIQQHLDPNDFAFRYGGEEFAIICVEKTQEQLFDIVERIRNDIAQESHPELGGEKVTISIGMQTYQSHMNKVDFFSGTDNALYNAKKTGKNKTVIG
ncbi:GGDEF domain-containing protein [Paenibacillus aestuarii]|uniref:GGDEF domain-containing protein n=1 Tax=Paenibacillus aestuarii TaxID=516965 RepID=A0ABW0K213_9BACL|nr:GGDEF domain-containing protein [Paenibacillus aestuarii]